ncbi:4-(cytidine 5'-diphospho)-2-C-methyl-D-erythritol kinase [Aquibium carbonis]|uniref:4-diphosphocytidyl-2-C-methyl-D-erythritol kinase n=1 Tax=Aquibium carbonis TaxID=2495581 RepID=A0A3R9Y7T0_9HYPH|nr:4-(cytidine 5'-diphospho)-2-C-methyl-D-erythritol kinase [Aquibium carbonis]RST85130.1 4-(cytidine 5'-diphospho)-2-C-methyl-D-erythritol kinase [Aquibium carbonis]
MTHRTAALAPAKINLALHVTGRRADGYHLLESLVVFAEFGDRLSVEAAPTDAMTIGGPRGSGLPTGPDNLVTAARDRMRAAFGTKATPPVAVHLDKFLPVASGIGGGSSDAAAALKALAAFWGLDVASTEIADIAASLGADVPMCLDGRALVASGIGHDLRPLLAWPSFHVVLVNPGVAVSTPVVFAGLSRRQNPPLPPLPDCPDHAGALAFLGAARNDLEAPALALAPQIGEALDALRSAGASFARMSGSGATCFGIFADNAEAQASAAQIRSARPGWFVEATRTTGAG